MVYTPFRSDQSFLCTEKDSKWMIHQGTGVNLAKVAELESLIEEKAARLASIPHQVWGRMWGTKGAIFLFVFLKTLIRFFGAGGGTRTHTGIRPSDFKSDMSTIPSRPHGAAPGAVQFPYKHSGMRTMRFDADGPGFFGGKLRLPSPSFSGWASPLFRGHVTIAFPTSSLPRQTIMARIALHVHFAHDLGVVSIYHR